MITPYMEIIKFPHTHHTSCTHSITHTTSLSKNNNFVISQYTYEVFIESHLTLIVVTDVL